ncbi:hypothetical protein M3Y95_00101200 [Aphelenchoides besseyi]|nr:hypothetical protein M3Y95_00101200 [Aphelenchoides besseyi]
MWKSLRLCSNFVLLAFCVIPISCRLSRHIHQFNAHRRLLAERRQSEQRNKWAFVLRCPVIASDQKLKVSVAWLHNNDTVISLVNGKLSFEPSIEKEVKIRKWTTLSGHLNFLVDWAKRLQFEFEERRRWYAMRIRKISEMDIGVWRCRMITRSANDGTTRLFESRARIDDVLPNDSINYTVFQKRNVVEGNQTVIDNTVIFTKPNSAETVFQRVNRFNEIAYMRNTDIIDRKHSVDNANVRQNFSTTSNSTASLTFFLTHCLLCFSTFVTFSLVY